ncbi:MAG: hypothetical protein ACP5K9_01595 [Candidatus Micrarchaeia archaeon]
MTGKRLFDFRMPAAAVCSAAHNIEDALKIAKSLSNGEDFVQLMAYSVRMPKRLLPAYLNVMLRLREGSITSKSTSMEMLLLACGKSDIRAAISKCGAKEGKMAIVFASAPSLLSNFLDLAGMKAIKQIKLKIDFKEANAVALAQLR